MVLFVLVSLATIALFIFMKSRRVKDEVTKLMREAHNKEELFNAILGQGECGELCKERQAIWRRLMATSNITKIILTSSVLSSLITLLYWIMLAKSDIVLTMSLVMLCLVPLAIIFNDARTLFIALKAINKMNRTINELMNKVDDKIFKAIHGDEPPVHAVVEKAGDLAKSATKKLIDIRHTLLILLPSDNVFTSAGVSDQKALTSLSDSKSTTDELRMQFLALFIDPRERKAIVDSILNHREGIFMAKVQYEGFTKRAAVVLRRHEVKGAMHTVIFVDGEPYMRMVIKPVTRGREHAANVFQERSVEVHEIIEWARARFERSIFVTFMPLQGTVGWSVAAHVIMILKDRPLMTILVKDKSDMNLRDGLTRDTKGGEFKIQMSREVLKYIIKRSKLFILNNMPSDSFDINTTANILAVIDACAKGSSGTADLNKLLARAEMSPIQLIKFHKEVVEGFCEKDITEENIKNIARDAVPEALLVAGSSKYPGWIPRVVMNSDSNVSGFIVCYGLYGIIDEELREILDLALMELWHEVAKRAKIPALSSDDIDKTLSDKRIALSQDEAKKVLLILGALRGDRMLEPMVETKPVEVPLTTNISVVHDLLEKLAKSSLNYK